MKKLILLFMLTSFMSYSQKDSKLLNKNIEYEKPPKDYKLIEKNVIQLNDSTNNQKINFFYENDKISKVVNVSKKFKYEDFFEYKEGRLEKKRYINSNPALNVLTTFEYDEQNKLKLIVIERMSKNEDKSKNTFVRSAEIEIKYEGNKIETLSRNITEKYPPEKKTILTDQNGNFTSVTSSDPRRKTTYDGKNNPSDLMLDKSLMAYSYYGAGNVLTYYEIFRNEYEYNNYGFPVKQKGFQSGKLTSITTYTYNY